MEICIDNIVYPYNNHEVFPLIFIHVLFHMFQGVCYAWASYIISHMYHDLHNFVMLQKSGKIVAYSLLLHCWAYEHICVCRPREFPAPRILANHPTWFTWDRINKIIRLHKNVEAYRKFVYIILFGLNLDYFLITFHVLNLQVMWYIDPMRPFQIDQTCQEGNQVGKEPHAT